jgi:hypothetical protein
MVVVPLNPLAVHRMSSGEFLQYLAELFCELMTIEALA